MGERTGDGHREAIGGQRRNITRENQKMLTRRTCVSSILKSAQETRGQDIPKQHIPRKPRKSSELGRSVSILAGPSQFMKGFVYRLRSLGFIPKIKEKPQKNDMLRYAQSQP